MSPNYLLPHQKNVYLFHTRQAPYPHIFSDFIQLGPLISCWKSLFSRDFIYFTTHTHTHALITITPPPLPSPSLPVSARLSPLQPCLPVRKVLQCWRLGYRPPGPLRTRASRRRTPRLGLPSHGSNHGDHRYFHQVYRRVPAVRGAREVSSSRNVIVFVLSFCPPPPQPRLTLFLVSQLA